MPGDRMENTLAMELPRSGTWRSVELGVSSSVVFAQTRLSTASDFSAPPDTYHLLGLQASVTRPLGKGDLRIGLQATNLLNTAYRDYLDRFRYYADARGTDITIWLRYRIGVRGNHLEHPHP